MNKKEAIDAKHVLERQDKLLKKLAKLFEYRINTEIKLDKNQWADDWSDINMLVNRGYLKKSNKKLRAEKDFSTFCYLTQLGLEKVQQLEKDFFTKLYENLIPIILILNFILALMNFYLATKK